MSENVTLDMILDLWNPTGYGGPREPMDFRTIMNRAWNDRELARQEAPKPAKKTRKKAASKKAAPEAEVPADVPSIPPE